MDQLAKSHFDNLYSDDATSRYASFQYLIKITDQPVDWAYEIWDNVLLMLRDKNNHRRAIAAQLLSNLSKSDAKNRILKDIDELIKVTKDEKFVTARHSLQSLWKIAVAKKEFKKKVTDLLVMRFNECVTEKNCTLIRYDIIEVFRKIYDQLPDEKVKDQALQLISTEEDIKYKKKYAGVWKDITGKAKA